MPWKKIMDKQLIILYVSNYRTIQFSSWIPEILSNSQVFSVTIIKLCSIAVHPISKSKSLIIIPPRRNRVFSLPYRLMALKIGSTGICSEKWETTSKLCAGALLFSAQKTSSAKVTSEMAHLSIPTDLIFWSKPNFPLKRWMQILVSSRYFIRSEGPYSCPLLTAGFPEWFGRNPGHLSMPRRNGKDPFLFLSQFPMSLISAQPGFVWWVDRIGIRIWSIFQLTECWVRVGPFHSNFMQ